MPELPDIMAYLSALDRTIVGHRIERVQVLGPNLLRTWEPPVSAAEGRAVVGLRRLGKRIVWSLSDDLFLVFHLMIAGRYRWHDRPVKIAGKIVQAGFVFDHGTLLLTEAGSRKRAALHLVADEKALAAHDPGGVDVLTCTAAEFAAALRHENHTLKRALTDPRLLDGIGNAWSDEILRAAGLSPLALTGKLSDAELTTLHTAAREVLTEWIDRLQDRFRDRFPGPGDITAFRPEFCVHGKYGQPCGACGTTVQRIRYADHETNYCPRCQTHGRLLADRSLSRLLRDDWPKSIEELEG